MIVKIAERKRVIFLKHSTAFSHLLSFEVLKPNSNYSTDISHIYDAYTIMN